MQYEAVAQWVVGAHGWRAAVEIQVMSVGIEPLKSTTSCTLGLIDVVHGGALVLNADR